MPLSDSHRRTLTSRPERLGRNKIPIEYWKSLPYSPVYINQSNWIVMKQRFYFTFDFVWDFVFNFGSRSGVEWKVAMEKHLYTHHTPHSPVDTKFPKILPHCRISLEWAERSCVYLFDRCLKCCQHESMKIQNVWLDSVGGCRHIDYISSLSSSHCSFTFSVSIALVSLVAFSHTNLATK